MVVDGEGGDLLDQLQEVDGAVEEGRLEFAFELDVLFAGLNLLDVVREVDEGDDVDGELAEDGANDVGVKDVGLWSLFRQAFDGLRCRLVWAGPGDDRADVPLLLKLIGSRRS